MQSFKFVSVFLALAASVALGQSQPPNQSSTNNRPNDTTNQSSTNNGPNDTTNQLTPSETRFVEETLKGGRSEVEMAQAALMQGASSDVKGFAQRLVNDHTAANKKLEQIAVANKLPAELNTQSGEPRKDARTNSAVVGKPADSHLAGLKGPEFDRAFAKMMVENHQAGIAKHEAMEKEASNAELKAYLRSTLPTLREHLQQAQSLAK